MKMVKNVGVYLMQAFAWTLAWHTMTWFLVDVLKWKIHY